MYIQQHWVYAHCECCGSDHSNFSGCSALRWGSGLSDITFMNWYHLAS